METFNDGTYDVIVIGAGHAGVEAALASARMGNKTLILTLNPDSISFMACNPSIGGTAKGHLVREIDALGGEMGINADNTLLQLRMLNRGKGAAVQSLRAQSDKHKYHERMKRVLENTENLTIRQGEAMDFTIADNAIKSVITTIGMEYFAKAIVLATGVYLNSETIIGDKKESSGPSGFKNSHYLSDALKKLGFNVRRFKTGTPARVHARSLDFSKMDIQEGESDVPPFSFLTEKIRDNQIPCHLTYTNLDTHKIILDNLSRSPLYSGAIKGVGPRYCPSIEDKVVRFKDKEQHQIFIEPESESTEEMYVQGMSSSMPADVQIKMYRSIKGMENVEIIRNAYAIEYDCIDPLDLLPSLAFKKIKGIYTAGQINGSSGYEEAAAQGLIAGINASLFAKGKTPFVLDRSSSYIGVLIDDLVTKGTNEPYRMMTARAEHRIFLRQDNADERLTKASYDIGLATKERYDKFLEIQKELDCALKEAQKILKPSQDLNDYLTSIGETPVSSGISIYELLKRPNVTVSALSENFGYLKGLSPITKAKLETRIKYEGYLKRQMQEIEKFKKLESMEIPEDIDYNELKGLRLEARQKLSKIRPLNLGQAERISGVSPADISVLILALKSLRKNNN